MQFQSYPFIRFAFCLSLGIVGHHYLGEYVFIGWPLIIVAFVFYVFLALRNSRRYQLVLSSIALFLLFGLGTQRLHYYKGESQPEHLLNVKDSIRAYRAVIIEEPQKKAKSIRLVLEMRSVLTKKGWSESDAWIAAYVDPEKGLGLAYGDVLLVQGSPSLTQPPANPGEFDYRSYLVYNRINHQQFIGEDFIVFDYQPPSWFVVQANKLRSRCAQVISSYITDEYARAVVLALVLGVKEDLQDELVQAFSTTGAMHVLAVSGLHVGIIYAIVILILTRLGMDKKKHRKSLALISIVALWSYALLTGLSPSVLRAVTMFSFIALGRATAKKTNIYNTLAASAVVLLLYNPYLIMSVGFQLSYLAVFGIVYLQPKLYNLVEVKHGLLDKIWTITCVSIAAQLATAPLSILYFHQFPTYFLVSNLFVIPAAFIILVSGIILLVLSLIPSAALVVGWLLTKIVLGLNTLVLEVSHWPGSTIQGIYYSILDTWLVYGTMVCLIWCLVKKRPSYLKYAIGFTFCFAVSQIGHFTRFSKNREFSVLNASNASVLDFRSGFTSSLVSDSLFSLDKERQHFHLFPKRLISGSKQNPAQDKLAIVKEELPFGQLVVFDGFSFLKVDSALPTNFKPSEPLSVDYLILAENGVDNLKGLLAVFDFDKLIIDSSNSYYIDQSLVRQSERLGVNYHSIRKNGYYSSIWKTGNL